MKTLRIAVLVASALALLCVVQLNAQSAPANDPQIRTGGGHGSVAVTSPFFSVITPSGNSPALSTVPDSTDCVLLQPGQAPAAVPGCIFQNKIVLPGGGKITITRLIFVVDNADFSGTLVCGTDTVLGGTGPFSACRIQPAGDGTLSVATFFNGSIPFGGDFSMGMRGFNGNTGFVGVALRSRGDSSTASLYEHPGLAPLNATLDRVVNDRVDNEGMGGLFESLLVASPLGCGEPSQMQFHAVKEEWRKLDGLDPRGKSWATVRDATCKREHRQLLAPREGRNAWASHDVG